ncbi:cbb3-type cytochrome c oxidase subunit I [Bacillus sp. SL00103]
MFSENELLRYKAMVASIVAISVLSFLVWVHHLPMGNSAMVNSILLDYNNAISVPTGVKIFNWLFTMHRGCISFTSPMLCTWFHPELCYRWCHWGWRLRWRLRDYQYHNTCTSLYPTSTMY